LACTSFSSWRKALNLVARPLQSAAHRAAENDEAFVGDLPAVVFESDPARSAPIALAPPLIIQRQSVELLIGICHQQLSVSFLVGLEPGQIAQPVIIVGDSQLVIQIRPVADIGVLWVTGGQAYRWVVFNGVTDEPLVLSPTHCPGVC